MRQDKKRQTVEAKLLVAIQEGSLESFAPGFFDRLRECLPATKKKRTGGGP